MTALVVEHKDAMRRKLGALLGELGFEVRFAASAGEAVSLSLAEPGYSLWVVDLGLPPGEVRGLAAALFGARAPTRVIALLPSKRARSKDGFNHDFARKVQRVCPESVC